MVWTKSKIVFGRYTHIGSKTIRKPWRLNTYRQGFLLFSSLSYSNSINPLLRLHVSLQLIKSKFVCKFPQLDCAT
ncbi:hypothetical protein ERIC2_c30730 [Paenibacillus larvae subsp. larvae DSM 25430]|uniref:Uncharacterized protein n=1 Tax=Paenibacillus larvae subsp. larvae DSM 25430 TaxID=697284 RepID=V9W9L0_9BACL|nr:hypothetical protein ERIC2_c30730 [Paenibacillus larvae subsp. larvae DSM 25430]